MRRRFVYRGALSVAVTILGAACSAAAPSAARLPSSTAARAVDPMVTTLAVDSTTVPPTKSNTSTSDSGTEVPARIDITSAVVGLTLNVDSGRTDGSSGGRIWSAVITSVDYFDAVRLRQYNWTSPLSLGQTINVDLEPTLASSATDLKRAGDSAACSQRSTASTTDTSRCLSADR